MASESKTNYLKSAGIVSFSTFISRILGLIREIAVASAFGAGSVLDAFVLAFTIPNLFRRFFGEGAISAAFIPVFTDVLENKGEDQAWQLASKTVTLLFLILATLVVIGSALCLCGQYTGMFSEKAVLALGLMATMMPYLLFICLAAFLGALLNALRHFFTPAIAPAILNIVWILGIVVVAPLIGTRKESWAYTMAVAILVGGILQLLIQYPALRQKNVVLRLNLDFHDSLLYKVLINMIPVIFGAAVHQINILCDQMIAWLMIPNDGALSVIYMADRVLEFPLAIVGISLATAVFPMFSRYAVRKEYEQFGQIVPESLRLSFFLTFPASVGLAILAFPITSLLYQHQNYTMHDTYRTSNVLIIYGMALWIYILLQIITKAFYSLSDTRTPPKVAMFCVGINLILNLSTVPFLAEVGLAISTAIAGFIHCSVLLFLLQKKVALCWTGIKIFVFKIVVSTTLMGITVLFALSCLTSVFNIHGSIRDRLIIVAVPIVLGIAVYFGSSFILGIREMTQFTSSHFPIKIKN